MTPLEIKQLIDQIYSDHEAIIKAKDEKLKQLNDAYAEVANDFESAVMEIERLKALQQRSCESCKGLVEIGKSYKHCEELAINISHMDWGNFCCNRYEPKEQ